MESSTKNGTFTDTYGNKEWYKDGLRHREDGPAIVLKDGIEIWYKDGKKHRDNDLPAVVDSDGTEKWYKDGKKHRDNDLPAVIYGGFSSLNREEWWLNGELHREKGPAVIDHDTGWKYYKNGKLHRLD